MEAAEDGSELGWLAWGRFRGGSCLCCCCCATAAAAAAAAAATAAVVLPFPMLLSWRCCSAAAAAAAAASDVPREGKRGSLAERGRPPEEGVAALLRRHVLFRGWGSWEPKDAGGAAPTKLLLLGRRLGEDCSSFG